MQSFKTVPDITIACGGAARIETHIKPLCANKRICVVTDKGVRELGLIDAAIAALRGNRYEVLVFDDVVPDPPQDIVLRGVAQIKAFGAGLIIGFGGGSSMDTAKIMAYLAKSNQPIDTLYGVGLASGTRLPLMMVPTTAGTGSEVTNVAILTTGETEKKGIVDNVLYADRVLLDSELTIGLPKMITASTGIDAMVHAIEAYTSLPQKNPLSDSFALSALSKLRGALERVCADGGDMDARTDMLIGSMLAGQAFSNAPCAAVHALAYPLGGFFHVPHGLSNALVLTEVMKYNLPKADMLYGEIAEFLRIGGKAINLIEEMQRLKDATKVPQTLSAVEIQSSAIPMMAQDAMTKERLLVNNPRAMHYDAVVEIYENIA